MLPTIPLHSQPQPPVLLLASLIITGVAAGNKTYDGTIAATLNTGTANLATIYGSDNVNLEQKQCLRLHLSDKNIGTGRDSNDFRILNIRC